MVASLLLKDSTVFFRHDRFSDIFTVLSILPGFFIASLAAISAINKRAIDEVIDRHNNPPYLIKYEPNRTETYRQPLSRRLFLTLLFAYLSALSLALVIILIIARFYFFDIAHSIFVYFFHFIVFGAMTQLFLLTLIGISYLGYKALADN